jgi:hypothetical protein
VDYRPALFFIGFGLLGLGLEFAFPSFMRELPWANWAMGEVRAGRYSRVVSCLACVVIGLAFAGVFPSSWHTALLVLFIVALVYGLARDAVAESNRQAAQTQRTASRSEPRARPASVRTPPADRPPRGRQKPRRRKR